jgi:hypothetical protein
LIDRHPRGPGHDHGNTEAVSSTTELEGAYLRGYDQRLGDEVGTESWREKAKSFDPWADLLD